ncbi:unannotated protein [freshwater metagenome]|uniref:Unannotated protein n=1 Tax=freshwater metagenome TaxID=449393 RepID=A0A6J7J4B1_9ZZZZ
MTPTAAMIGACRARSRSRNPRPSTTPTTSGVFEDSAASRSWFSAGWPPTLVPGGSSARRRSTVRPSAGSDASAFGITGTTAIPSAPFIVGITRAIPRSAPAAFATAVAPPVVVTSCS